MLNVCSEQHDEIVFEGRKCPFCESIDKFESEIESLNDVITDMKREEESE